MENNENIPQEPIIEENIQQEPVIEESMPQEQIPKEPVAQEPVAKPIAPKASPFADSPYVMEEPVYTKPEIPSVQRKPRKKGRGKKVLKALLASVLIVALMAVSCGITAFSVNLYWNRQQKQVLNGLYQEIERLEQEIKDNSYTGQGNSVSGTPVPVEGLTPGQIHAQNKNSVVGIANQGVTTNIFGQVTETASAGSGFVISQDGYIVTNYHVIEGAKTLTVITNNEEEFPATVVGYDEGNDFALIKVDVTGWTPVKLGSSDDLIVGDQVVAIGNPLGEITNSLTVGYISVKDRDVTIESSIINMLQTDTAINPGNSGGPLFNMKGEVIGITTAKYSGNAVESIGFAIPIDDVSQMITELLEKGFISAPYMGVQITDQADGIGVYVYSVEPGSPAAKAGLRKGDIIVGIGDIETPTLSSLDKALRNFEPDDTTTIQVYRNRQVVELSITFGSKYQPAS